MRAVSVTKKRTLWEHVLSLLNQAELLLKTRDKLNKILSENTGKPIEQIEKDTDRDNFMTSDEAKEYGLIDEVMRRK